MKYRRLLMMDLLRGSLKSATGHLCLAFQSLQSSETFIMPSGKAGQTTAATQALSGASRGEESPGSIEQDAG
jgi:hypothetical protein